MEAEGGREEFVRESKVETIRSIKARGQWQRGLSGVRVGMLVKVADGGGGNLMRGIPVKKANYVDIVFGVPAQSRLIFQAGIFPDDNIVHRPRGLKKVLAPNPNKVLYNKTRIN